MNSSRWHGLRFWRVPQENQPVLERSQENRLSLLIGMVALTWMWPSSHLGLDFHAVGLSLELGLVVWASTMWRALLHAPPHGLAPWMVAAWP